MENMTRGREANGGTPPSMVLSPDAAKAVAAVTDAMTELASLRLENQELRNELKVQRATVRELQHVADGERMQKETFQRFAIKIETLLEGIARAAQQAHEAAISAAQQQNPMPALDAVHRELSGVKGAGVG